MPGYLAGREQFLSDAKKYLNTLVLGYPQQIANSSKKFIHKMSSKEDLSVDLTDLFVSMGKMAEKTGYAICFFVDEIQYMKEAEVEALVNAIHRCNQLRLPIMIFGAGLPKILKMLGEIKSYSERLFKFEEIGALSELEAK